MLRSIFLQSDNQLDVATASIKLNGTATKNGTSSTEKVVLLNWHPKANVMT